MPGRRRWRSAAAASVVGHLLVVGWLGLQATRPPPRVYGEDALTIDLAPPRPIPRPPSRRPRHASSLAAAPIRRHSTPRPSEPAVTVPAGPSPAPGPALQSPPAQGAELAPGLSAALRRRSDCARRDAVGLSRAEREVCAGELARGGKTAPPLGDTVPADKRAYYDEVLAARNSVGHGPGFVCGVLFGGGQKPHGQGRPPHSLQIGSLPCYIVPPQGLLSPEVDVRDPLDAPAKALPARPDAPPIALPDPR